MVGIEPVDLENQFALHPSVYVERLLVEAGITNITDITKVDRVRNENWIIRKGLADGFMVS